MINIVVKQEMDDNILYEFGPSDAGSKSNSLLTKMEKEERMKDIRQTICLFGLSGHENPSPDLTTYGPIKLGWVQGVTIPCLLNIWGVMLFLRISWVVAHAGLGITLVIISISTTVCVITTLSLSSICTNGELEGGGIYYLVSRSLGAEMGASVGIIFAFANSVAASMNTIGFCESLNELLHSHGLKIIDNSVNDIRIVGAVALLVMCFICAVGMDWETKTQNFLIVTIVLAIFNFIIGALLGPKSDDEIAKGFVGISLENARKNWFSDYREFDGVHYEFFSIFAIYFPSVTGIQCGANICGDLRNPAKAIPKGTIWAIIISLSSYVSMSMLSGVAALRDASGDASNLDHSVLASCKPNCTYGLHNNFAIMQLMSLWAPLIYAGCWAATLSTALTNLLAVPRLIQALGIDHIYPGLIFFAKPFGRHGEPYRGYVLVYCISLMFLLIADLNTIAPLISNFYLASYALINFCTFHASFIDPISWRPTFTTFNKWLSLVGFALCLSIMIVISWMMALVTTFVFITLYLLVVYSKPEANWGGSTEYQRYRDTVSTILEISRRVESIKSYNPQNPAKAIPKGTIWAIIISLSSYVSMSMLSGVAALRDASGDASNLDHSVLASCKPNCTYGLHNNFAIMQLMSLWAPLIYAGCWAATLSTALTNLLAVPRLIQALGIDRIYPGLIFFAKPFGRHGEPYRGYVLVYCISLMFLLIADLNTIAPLISNFYLASYALINFCTFHASFIDPISWRPTFTTFNKWLSLVGFALCLSIMIVISWMMALVTTFVFITLYLLVVYSKPEANWGGSTEYQRYRDTVSTILEISRRVESIKSYNPQVLVLAGKPYSRPVLLDIGHLLTKVGSFMIVADIEPNELPLAERVKLTRLGEEWILSRQNRAFFVLLNGFNLERGLEALVQGSGLGRLSPNILLLGYKSDWNTCEQESTATYVRVIQMAFEEHLAVTVLRSPTMRRASDQYYKLEPSAPTTMKVRAGQRAAQSELAAIMHSDSEITLEDTDDLDSHQRSIAEAGGSVYKSRDSTSLLRNEWLTGYEQLSFSERKPIDAWWLYDDGGMNILLPYIIARRGFKEKRSFRIFALVKEEQTKDAESHMRKLLHTFRIEFNELTILRDVGKAPSQASWELFNIISEKFRTNEPTSDILITADEFRSQYRKTCRFLWLREQMLDRSSDASLIVMTLPIPRKGKISAFLYMAWLEVLSRDLPPIFFVRGNEKAVLDA